MRYRTSCIALLLAASAAGCDLISGPGDEAPPPLRELPRALGVDERAVIAASNAFAFDLLREVAARDTARNIFLSPLSASMALGMTMNGARGETLAGMRATLGFGALERAEINAAYRGLRELLLGLDGSVELRVANAIFTRRGWPVVPAFFADASTFFGAQATELDFDSPAALATINDWAKQNTSGRIPQILDDIPPEAVMFLLNAIYFRGDWTTSFPRTRTQDAPFFHEDGGQQPVRMMHLPEAKVRYLQTAELQAVDLPYGRQAFSMTLVLPASGRSARDLAASLDAAAWTELVDALAETQLDVSMPRFRVEYGRVLNETLIALGMGDAFDPGRADFSGISTGPRLFIQDVRQKTFVAVDEEGTEAAAVTSVGMGVTSAPPRFRADRPFVVAIRERLSGTILFLGIIGAPSE